MKKILFLPILALTCFITLSAAAEEIQVPMSSNPIIAAPAAAPPPTLGVVQQPKPALTPPLTVALTYYKLTGRLPDFDSWVKQQDSYKNANAFDQGSMVAPKVQKLKDAYSLILLTDPLVMETQVALSEYDKKNQGYSIESFKPSTFFPAVYNGVSYAIVPVNIADKQWIKVDDPEIVAGIEKAAGTERLLSMIIYLVPKYGDANSPASIDGENYWPMVAEIKKMMLYAPNSDTLLWQSSDVAVTDKTRQKIMNLYQ